MSATKENRGLDVDTKRDAEPRPTSKDGGGGRMAEGVPLGQFYKRELKPLPEIVMLSQPQSAIAERFRRLRASLLHKHGDAASVLVVTSAVPGEGKTTVALNLALAFDSDGEEKTLLVDADLRRPSIGLLVNPEPKIGLAEVLKGEVEPRHAIVTFKNSGLELLPAGEAARSVVEVLASLVAASPVELLSSHAAKSLFADLRRRYARIVIDTPPIVPFTDADVAGSMSDGVILVVREGMTPVDVYRQALESVTSTRVLGVVFNGSRRSVIDRSSYYDRYYAKYYSRERRS